MRLNGHRVKGDARVGLKARALALFTAAAAATFGLSGEAKAQFTGPGIYNISVAQTPDALDVDVSWGRGGSPGQPLNRWGRHNGQNQTFVVLADGPGFIIRPVHSLQCLDVSGAGRGAGTTVIQFPCHGGLNQRFLIAVDRTNPSTLIRPAHAAGMVLHARRSGAGVVLAPQPAPGAPLLVGMVFTFTRI